MLRARIDCRDLDRTEPVFWVHQSRLDLNRSAHGSRTEARQLVWEPKQYAAGAINLVPVRRHWF